MRAVQISQYSQDLEVSFVDIPQPDVTEYQVLVRGEYAGVDPHLVLATTGKVKIFDHYDFPMTLGNEISGIVVAVGEKITKFNIGDRVYAMPPLGQMGTFSEYVAIDEKYAAKVPKNLSFEEAASVPLSWLTTLQTFSLLQPQMGKKIFISGGTGGFGQIAVPYAVRLGLEVIVSGASRDKELAKQMGVQTFIDYEKPNYSSYTRYFDYVIDTRGVSDLTRQFKMLKKNGHLISLSAGPNKKFTKRQQQNFSMKQKIIFQLIGFVFDGLAMFQSKTYDFLYVEPSGKQLETYSNYLSQTDNKPIIDTIYDFEQAEEAIQRMKLGNNQGKILLKLKKKEETNG